MRAVDAGRTGEDVCEGWHLRRDTHQSRLEFY